MNVLFIVMDQFRADLLTGALENHIDLPNLRGLMAEAVSFENHHAVANPCGPSRASLLTGQYAMNHRSVRNGAPLRHDTPTLPRQLRQAGIAPLLFGYTDTTLDPRVQPPGDPALASYEQPMPGFYEIVEMQFETSMPWRAHLLEKGYDCPAYSSFYQPVAKRGQARRVSDPAFYLAEDSDTAFLTNRCLAHMSARGWGRALTHLTYIRPHSPLVAPAPYNEMYDPASLPPPASMDPLLGTHPFLAVPRDGNWAGGSVEGFPDLAPSMENVQAMRAVYLGLASEVDHHIGRVLDRLKSDGVYDETLIVITADHGEMLGDYGTWGKMTVFDAAFRVPLIIRDPRQPAGFGRKVEKRTESVDVMPTILEWLKCPVPKSVNGRSLLPFLDGDGPEDWRKTSYSELSFGDPVKPTRWQRAHGFSHRETVLAILRQGPHVLVQFACDYPPILFDHDADGEGRNVAGDPAYAGRLSEMTQAMLVHRMRNPDTTLSDIQITPDGPRE